ncbi:MAG: response regulator [Candidatus Rokuibacteriota bacterium]
MMPERKRQVLVVDDAGEMIVLCVNILQSLGYAVKGANRPNVALDLVGKELFDLMIVDYKMPDMNGFQVFERARALRPEMAFMLLTGHGSADVMQDAAERGFHAICLKPFTRDRLRTAVEQALRQRA